MNWDLMGWAQKRADALAERAAVNQSQPINHDDMYEGAPAWAVEKKHNLAESPNYQSGTYWFGPEALFIGYPQTGKAATIPFNPGIASYPLLPAAAGKGTDITLPK